MTIRGSIDGVSPESAFGWAFPGTGKPLLVQALLDGRILGESVADQYRHDLAEAGLGDGHCGFTIAFYEPIDPALLPFVTVKPAGGDVELPRTNLSGFVEFFRAIHARHPGAGRARSVLGGLWIDRTDAAALLAGRIASGATPSELENALSTLIGRGYVVIRGALPAGGLPAADEALPADRALDPRAGESERSFLESLAELLFRDTALRLLRAALDDNPVCFRAALARVPEASFTQPSAAEALPSPAECMALVAGPAMLDIVRGSHALPEFTADGRSRFLPGGPAAALELAVLHGASVETVEVGLRDLVLVAPGTLHRLRPEEGMSALRASIAPRRVTPVRVLAEPERAPFVLRHPSGAALAA